MFAFTYSEVVEESPEAARAVEYGAMDRVIAMLHAASAEGPGTKTEIEALYYLRRLWSIFLADVMSPANELPPQARAGIASIGLWINKEIDRLQRGETRDLAPIIEINEIVRDGLK
jgi:flagellar biosynthesis activator protein FlaF